MKYFRVKRSSYYTSIINQEKQEIKDISSCVDLDFVKRRFQRKLKKILQLFFILEEPK
jgi:hypothetical protein